MAAVLTGTPTVVTWAAGADPASQNITIPADATAVYMFYSEFDTAGEGVASITLNGAAPDESFGIADPAGQKSATGVFAWYEPPTGSQALDVAWNFAPSEGPTTIVAYVKGGDVTAWRDADAANNTAANAVSVTLTTVSGDLVLKYDQKFGATPPSTSAGWTSAQTATNNSESARLSYISATGTTQACDSEGEDYSSVAAVSIPAGTSDATPRPNSDVQTTNWASTGANFFGVIDEASFDDADYVTSPTITGVGQALICGLSNGPLSAGTYSPVIRASVSAGTATLRIKLLNDSNASQGQVDISVDTTLKRYDPTITITGSATRISFEFFS